MPFFTSSDKALWHLALPMIFSNITVPLLGLVDTAVIGHLDSPVYLGGVAVGATATSFLFMLLLFLRMSTTGLTAQAFGAKNPQAFFRCKIINARIEDFGVRISGAVGFSYFRNIGFQSDNHRFMSHSQTLHFLCCRTHNQRLSCTYFVVADSTVIQFYHPYRILLARIQIFNT